MCVEIMHVGLYIRAVILPKGTSVIELAKQLKVGRPALSNVLNGKARLSFEMAFKLEDTFGADAENLIAINTRFYMNRAREKWNGLEVS